MWTVHDDFGVAWCLEALLIESICGMLDVGVAIDLYNELKLRGLIAHIAAFIHHHDSELGRLLRNQFHCAWLGCTIFKHPRQVVTGLVRIDDVRVVVSHVRALAGCSCTKVEFYRVCAFFCLKL